MSQQKSHFLIYYLIVYIIFVVCLFISLKYYSRHQFTQSKFEQMINQRSSWRDFTDNPCKYQINGDPVYNSAGYIKLNLYCSNGTKSLNTISLASIHDLLTSQNVLKELARINGFDANLIIQNQNNWNCRQSQQEIMPDQKITPNSEINCYQK